jgi:hypothetical protein
MTRVATLDSPERGRERASDGNGGRNKNNEQHEVDHADWTKRSSGSFDVEDRPAAGSDGPIDSVEKLTEKFRTVL